MASKLLTLPAMVLGLALVGTAAGAQSIEFGPGGVRVDPYGTRDDRGPVYRDRRGDDGVGRREAVRAARAEGLAEVDSVDFDGRRYRIQGSDRGGRDMRVVVDGRSGDVVRVMRAER